MRSALITILALTALSSAAADSAGAVYDSEIQPFLKAHCIRCHGPEKQKAKLALHTIDVDVPAGKDIEKWKAIAERLTLNEMPPESEPRPDAARLTRVLAWIKSELGKGGVDTADAERKLRLPGHGNRVDHEALFSGKVSDPAASPARVWRMSPQAYSMLLPRISGSKDAGKSKSFGQAFSSVSTEGFKDYASLYVIDEPTIGQLMRNAQAAVEIQCQKKSSKEFLELIDSPAPSSEKVKAAIRRQFQIALLRDPTSEESDRFLQLFEKNEKEAGPVAGAKSTLAAVLMLPEAMYRLELGGKPDAHGRRLLAPRELAYAIAFALTDEPPDGTLLKAAECGRLASNEVVRREVERILNDKKIEKPRIPRFFEEYFEYPAAADVFKDLNRGEWRAEILINDTRLLIQHILDEDRDVLKQLLTTNKSFVNYRADPKAEGGALPARVSNKPEDPPKNEKEAEKRRNRPPKPRQMEYWDLYNLPPDWTFTAKQPLELPADQRAGILTQPSWLAAFATNNENHAIRRGKWVRERLLGGVVPDLPITVDAQLPDAPEKTMRQRMEITKQEYCWQCHQKMNPLGLAFESYDYLGRWRDKEPVLDPEATAKNVDAKGKPRLDKDGKPVPVMREAPLDSSGLVEHSGDPMIDGVVSDAVTMIKKLAGSPRVRQVFVRHAFRYWMGRNETLADSPTLVAADKAYTDNGGSMKALITSLLTSDSFLFRVERTKVTAGE